MVTRLAVFRAVLRLRQLDLVRISGIDGATLSLVERGHRRPSRELAEKIANALPGGLAAADLFPEVFEEEKARG